MSDRAVEKYETDLRRLHEELARAQGWQADCAHRLAAFIANRDTHIAYNRAVQDATSSPVTPRRPEGWRYGYVGDL